MVIAATNTSRAPAEHAARLSKTRLFLARKHADIIKVAMEKLKLGSAEAEKLHWRARLLSFRFDVLSQNARDPPRT